MKILIMVLKWIKTLEGMMIRTYLRQKVIEMFLIGIQIIYMMIMKKKKKKKILIRNLRKYIMKLIQMEKKKNLCLQVMMIKGMLWI